MCTHRRGHGVHDGVTCILYHWRLVIEISISTGRRLGSRVRGLILSLVLVARGRAKVSAAAAASDWPKRIQDMLFVELDGSVGFILLGREHWVFSSIWALRIG